MPTLLKCHKKMEGLEWFNEEDICGELDTHPLVLAKYIRAKLNIIYEQKGMSWNISRYEPNIALVFGKVYLKTNLQSNEYLHYYHENKQDCVIINLPKNNFIEAKKSYLSIVKDLKKAGF